MRKPKRYWWLIDKIKEHKINHMAEVGVAKGNTTVRLMKHCPWLRLYAVDMWTQSLAHTPYSEEIYKDWDFIAIKKEFDKKLAPYKDRMIVLQGISWEMADAVHDGFLGMVFIDADHGYETVKRDILAWTEKLHGGGIICGHDINLDSVRQAVTELIPTYRVAGVDNVWWAFKEEVLT